MLNDSIIHSGKTPQRDLVREEKTFNWRSWRIAALIFGFYTFLLLLFLPQVYLYSLEPGQPAWYVYAGRLALAHYIWAVLTPFIFWLGNRFPVERPKLLRNLILHLIWSLIFAAAQTIAYQYILGFFHGQSIQAITNWMLFRTPGGWGFLLNSVTNGFIFYAASLAFNQAVNYSRKYRDREFRLQQAELETLKTQLHPHFLFNTLNAIAALVYVSPPNATKTISQLSDLLRLTLHNNKAHEVTLKEELDFLRKYIQIQQTLFQERLEIEWVIEPETLDALVPNMLLQPLVENSIRHGIAPKEDGGRIEIFSRQLNSELLLEIKDNGVGSKSDQERKSGIGLINSKARLQHLYGTAQKFDSGPRHDGGWRVTIIIPFREQSEEVSQ